MQRRLRHVLHTFCSATKRVLPPSSFCSVLLEWCGLSQLAPIDCQLDLSKSGTGLPTTVLRSLLSLQAVQDPHCQKAAEASSSF